MSDMIVEYQCQIEMSNIWQRQEGCDKYEALKFLNRTYQNPFVFRNIISKLLKLHGKISIWSYISHFSQIVDTKRGFTV